MAGRCIPKVPDGVIEMGGEQLKNLQGDPITSEVLTEASGILGHFYKATEVTVTACNV